MRISGLFPKSKLVGGIVILTLLIIAGVEIQTQEKVQAQGNPLYFGEPRKCELYDPVKCPPGTVEDGNYCRPLTSEFCRVFTGSPNVSVVNYNGENRPVCVAQPVLGSCSAGAIDYRPPSSSGSMSGVPASFTTEVRGLLTTFNETVESSALINSFVFEDWATGVINTWRSDASSKNSNDPNIWNFLFNGGSDTPYLKNNNAKAIACLSVEGNPRQYLSIPVLRGLEVGEWSRDYDKQAIDIGFVFPKPKDGNYYCRSANHTSVYTASGITKCTSQLDSTGRGCTLAVNSTFSNQSQSYCLYNPITSPSTNNRGGFGPTVYFDGRNPSSPGVVGGNVSFDSTNPESNFCRQNAKDIFAVRSNKGCSDFVTLDSRGNTLSADSAGRYNQCVKCLYGEAGTLGEMTSSLTVATGMAQPQKGELITPYNEPLAIPIPGQLYTDLGGCINASSTGSVVNTIVRVALGVMGGIVILRIIQGALTMQKGDPEGFQEGREVITSALIGLLLLIFSAALLNFLGINILGLDVATFGS